MTTTRRLNDVRRLAPVALALASLAGCVQPIEEDRRLGLRVAEQLDKSVGIYSDPAIETYINEVGGRVLAQQEESPFSFEFFILDQEEPNAFAAPGGFVFVSRGLLATVQSEDELANALGHEIIHVTRRHTARSMAKRKVPGVLALPGRAVGLLSRDLGNLLNLPVNTVGAAVFSAHSRQDELEADRYGMALCALAGYDPRAMAPLLERMERVMAERTGGERQHGFFDTHPTTPDRERRIARRAGSLTVADVDPIARDRAEFLDHLDGVLLGSNPAHGVFAGQDYLHPDLDLLIRFPEGWQTINTPMFVAGAAPDKDAMLLLGVASEGDDVETPARAFVELLSDSDLEPSLSEATQVGIWPAYVVTLDQASDRGPLHLRFLWFAHGGVVYNVIGIAPAPAKDVLAGIDGGMRTLTSAERSSIRATRLRIERARAGEDLAALSARTNNVWDITTTAIMNDLDDGQSLPEGLSVKIARSEAYGG